MALTLTGAPDRIRTCGLWLEKKGFHFNMVSFSLNLSRLKNLWGMKSVQCGKGYPTSSATIAITAPKKTPIAITLLPVAPCTQNPAQAEDTIITPAMQPRGRSVCLHTGTMLTKKNHRIKPTINIINILLVKVVEG